MKKNATIFINGYICAYNINILIYLKINNNKKKKNKKRNQLDKTSIMFGSFLNNRS